MLFEDKLKIYNEIYGKWSKQEIYLNESDINWLVHTAGEYVQMLSSVNKNVDEALAYYAKKLPKDYLNGE